MSTSQTSPAPRRRKTSVRAGLTRLFNRIVLAFAGTRLMPLYGVLEHRGRRSGRLFRTPIVVRPIPDGFIVPMPWGETTDWYRNVRAAGQASVRWKNRTYQLDRPEVLAAAEAGAAFGGVQSAAMQRFGIKQVLRLRHRGDHEHS